MKKIGIIGTGIFGTALALTAARAGCDVLCWDRNPDVINAISQKHLNTKHLPNIPLPDAIKSTSEIAEVFDLRISFCCPYPHRQRVPSCGR